MKVGLFYKKRKLPTISQHCLLKSCTNTEKGKGGGGEVEVWKLVKNFMVMIKSSQDQMLFPILEFQTKKMKPSLVSRMVQ